MRVFLTNPVRTEAEIETVLACEPRFVDLPCGACPMIWMPKATWDALMFAIESGYESTDIVEWALRLSHQTGLPFELTYPDVIYYAAHVAARPA